ncbi:hypothetical protein HME9304_01631 [Flagellimonas maritima]|uniref:Uncharacterized protein n=1 Tax=Flagellimonas maritima TaxID=1383885 RepID=A0A2Z4LTE2_9FLAO|nr:hypothetical protein HME9304_01631 [Allomuricauda aurantiaca]
MRAFVLFDVLCNLFGNYIMMSEQVTEKRRKFFAMVGSRSIHKLGFVWESISTIWESKNAKTIYCNFILYT